MTDFYAKPATVKAALIAERNNTCPHKLQSQIKAWEEQHKRIMETLGQTLMSGRIG